MSEITTDLIDTVNKIIVDYFIVIITFFIICILAIPAFFLNIVGEKINIEKKSINTSFNILIMLIIICTYLFLFFKISNLIPKVYKSCNKHDPGNSETSSKTFFKTIFPFLIIFCFGILIIIKTPSWVHPFSNTIGIFMIRLIYQGKFNDFIDNLNKSKPSQPSELSVNGPQDPMNPNANQQPNPNPIEETPNKSKNKENKNKILKLFSELNLDDITSEYDNIDMQILNKYIDDNYEDTKMNITDEKIFKQLLNYLIMKKVISLNVWSILLGIVTILISINRTLDGICNNITLNQDEFEQYLEKSLN
tara:strand:+ start:24379 stop:25299 length:921 start_codon:yes stop_codon:yes gene_type:complete